MRERIKTFLCILLLLCALPYIITVLFQGKNETGEQIGAQTMEANQEEETLLVGVLAHQMPASYEMEALKAQAVIARTNLMLAQELEQELPKTISQEELLKLWGEENFSANYQKLSAAVEATEGIVMTYQGSHIYADFHAVSAGWTRNGEEALESEKMPWLQSVESSKDIPAEDYLKVIFLEKSEFKERLEEAFEGVTIDEEKPLDEISIEKRDKGEYVQQLKVAEKTVTGEEFRDVLGLNSSCFYLKEVEGKIRIVTKGLGHGLGMSQYGANVMAKEGADYREILTYYYKNIQISD